ncbi:MAG: pantetheine-phosphate adenylyltransferase [Candidatus Omnitrophica bacterium]|nr:MAG: Phosphopantetheine adenylyltransferase [Candidatus Hinthialibacteria bacterium OLB16]MBE7486917.1 pantetheine-phosphate adenylyltransferase [bacterium]MBK7496163.1 pantetheine-phosphate adenylyltransferase [Candidatus Omnitrophota bacterium]MCE7908343.1 pantetheine-phosphate adenylyltransferase [Candidatus Omnitrophica bacterium COP1]MBV6481629.1 Phosphopantetheine adenylyltransferase [bacterium]
MKHLRAVYPGSFDPVTWGHVDLIHRGLTMVDELVVAVLANPGKQTLFSVAERVEMLEGCVGSLPGVRISQFDGLLVDFARKEKCKAILRGLRAVSDFEYEFQMALMNRRLDAEVDTLFLMPSEEHVFVSSRIARELAQFGGDLDSLVPELVKNRLQKRYPLQ